MRNNRWLTAFAVLVFAFLMIPLFIITVTAFGGGTAITFPIESVSLKWFVNVFTLKSFRRSFITSLEVAFLATFIALLVGVPAAYALARSHMKGKQLLKSFFLSPTIVPGYCYRFYPVSVSDPDFPSAGTGKPAGRTLYGDAALCDPGGRLFHGAV